MSGIIRGWNNPGLGLVGITLNEGNPGKGEIELMQRELGITHGDKKARAIVQAFQDPTGALEKYIKDREALDAATTKVYKETGATLLKEGFSQDTAMQYAKRRALAHHAAELELLNLSHPYAESAEDLIALASGAKRADLVKKK